MRKTMIMIGIVLACCLAKADKAYLGVCVEDAVSHVPLQGVKVTANFEDDIGWRAWSESANPDIAEGFTDKHGFCRLSGKTNCGRSSIWVDKAPKGYYEAAYGGAAKYTRKSLFGTWQPEDVVVTVALQRVEHPIPLYVRHIDIRNDKGQLGGFDGVNAVLRYDFVKGDWLPPVGEGSFADMTIRTRYDLWSVISNRTDVLYFYDFINEIEFSGEGNGIYEESFAGRNCGIKFRNAPESGYAHSKTLRFGSKKDIFGKNGMNVFMKYYTESDKERCYCFRIRSRYNDNGELIEAYYGKIYGDINFEGSFMMGFKRVKFLYYFNPESLDRNLEWDMKNNLCPCPGDIGAPKP